MKEKKLENQNYAFSKQQIFNFVDFYNTLKKIRNRLTNEGYIIKNNQIIPPQKNTDNN